MEERKNKRTEKEVWEEIDDYMRLMSPYAWHIKNMLGVDDRWMITVQEYCSGDPSNGEYNLYIDDNGHITNEDGHDCIELMEDAYDDQPDFEESIKAFVKKWYK